MTSDFAISPVSDRPGSYQIIMATGVISLGAAPPDMLATLLDKLPTGGLLAFSYNDPMGGGDDHLDNNVNLTLQATATEIYSFANGCYAVDATAPGSLGESRVPVPPTKATRPPPSTPSSSRRTTIASPPRRTATTRGSITT